MLKLWGDRRPAWMSWVVSHKARGNVVAIDGKNQWLVHRALPAGETDFSALDADQSLRDVLGVGSDFRYEVLNHEDWVGRRMVADRLRDRRVFVAGDAAHLWVPYAGYGMNAGIADGINLAWLLSNVIAGWAAPASLDAYEAERHPITEQVIDTYSKVALAKLYDRKHAITAADMLNDRVLPFFEEHGVPLLRILTDRGSEYCGNREHHEFELYLDVENIEHTRTKAKSPQTNGICERFHQTIQNEFYASAFRRKLYHSLEELQADLDAWMQGYNAERTHSGKYCYGKTPLQTFIESAPLALQKQLGSKYSTPQSETVAA